MKSLLDDNKDFREATKVSLEEIIAVLNKKVKKEEDLQRLTEFKAELGRIQKDCDTLKDKVNKFFQIIIMEKLNHEIILPSKFITYLTEIENDLLIKKHLPFDKKEPVEILYKCNRQKYNFTQ